MRAALIPEEAVEFERDWRAALARAGETLDRDVPPGSRPVGRRGYSGRRAARADQSPAGPVSRVYKVTTDNQFQPQIAALQSEVQELRQHLDATTRLHN
ncbi:hypothetical protein Atai01_05580 [Amycolatopsis taiwanensis]|uniref:Uncharacterized protein n=1 Tax=Amycolatopsis taiwanensis TaxID=342230 RepID=A0A9W6VEM2_9PSEU|nr:DUF6247 family protein [Amycolatopsis taiwanensis]GLY63939.1 hypothetical protein Atai01_05580 [Amycolatopsis taiwanensis]